MALVFTKTTSSLADEFVSSFSPDKLAIALFKISKDTGVEWIKQNKSYMVSGNWNNVTQAHALLENFLANIDLPFKQQDFDPGPAVTKTAQIRGRKPGTTMYLKTNTDLPKPLVVHHNQHSNSFQIETFVTDESGNSVTTQETSSVVSICNTKGLNCNKSETGINVQDLEMPPIDTAQDIEKNREPQTVSDANEMNTMLSETRPSEKERSEQEIRESVDDVVLNIKKEVNEEDFDEETDVDEQYLNDNEPSDNCRDTNMDSGSIKDEKESDSEFEGDLVSKNQQNRLKGSLKKKTKISTKARLSKDSDEEITDCSIDKEKSKVKVKRWALECPECDHVGKTRRHAREHYNRKHGPEIKCDVCGKVFHQKKDVNRHKREVHKMSTFDCGVCEKKFKHEKYYNEHIKLHDEDIAKPFCEICERSYSSQLILDNHRKKYHPNLKSSFKKDESDSTEERTQLKKRWKLNCPEPDCDYVGKIPKHVREHHRRAHGLARKCHICDKIFRQKKDLNRHVRMVHSDPSFFCDICGRLYKSARAHRDHMKVHETDYVKPSFTCEICQRSFSTKYVLTKHVKTDHLGIKKSYMCPICGRSFTQKNTYVQHANVHAGIKPYVCDICGKAFSYEKSLKEHKAIHGTERKYKCQVCDKDFKQKASLQIHKKIHEVAKAYICQNCGKGFHQKQALHRHERIHSGDKPYKCNLCEKTFNDYSIIRRHMIMLHKRDAKDSKTWKHDIICTLKRKTDFYIEGGPGYNSGERLRTEESKKSPLENIDQENADLELDLMTNIKLAKPGTDNAASKDMEVMSNDLGLKASSANVQEVIKLEKVPGQTLPEATETFHQLSRAAFPMEKNSEESSEQSPPHVPINYSVPTEISVFNRSSSSVPQEDCESRYQNVLDTYRLNFPPGLSHVQGMVGQQMVRGQAPHPTVETSQGQSLVPNWPYNGYPYYPPQ